MSSQGSPVFIPYQIIDPNRHPTWWRRVYDYLRQILHYEYDMDLRCKLSVIFSINSSHNGGDTALTIRMERMDNITTPIEGPLDFYYKPIDRLWRNVVGWPNGLILRLKGLEGNDFELAIPANPQQDVYSTTVSIPSSILKSNQDNPTEIPRQIFQYWDENIPPVLVKSMGTFRHLNPQHQHYRYSAEAAREYILQKEGSRTTTAFDQLRPSAFKADLWRYVVLFHEGGVYADVKIIDLVPLDSFLPSQGGLLVNDIRGAGLLNAFMAMPPTDTLLRCAIDSVVENVETKYYGQNILEISGPRLLFNCYQSLTPTQQQRYHRLQFQSTGILINNGSTPVLSQHNGEYRRLLSRPSLSTHYEQAWHSRTVYGETPIDAKIASPSLSSNSVEFLTIGCCFLIGIFLLYNHYRHQR